MFSSSRSRRRQDNLASRHLKETFEALSRSLAIIEFAIDGTILEANANFLDLLGYSLAEVVGRHHRMFVEPGEDRSSAYRELWTRLRQGQQTVMEFRRVAKGGRHVWIQASYNPVVGPDGTPYKVVKFASDITAAKMLSADHAGQMAAISRSQAVIEFKLDGTILNANENFLALLGYAAEEVVGAHHRMFVDPTEAAAPAYRAFWDELRAGTYKASEFKRFGKDGREVWIQASYNPIYDDAGQPFKIVKFATDITARKLADADAFGQIDAIGRAQAVIHFDLDGTILDANEPFLAAVGYELHDVLNQHHAMFVSEAESTSQAYADFWDSLRAGEYRSGEFARVARDGRTIWLQASYNPIFDLNGAPFKVVKYATDVTALVKQREKFNLLSLVADETENSVVITDRRGDIIYVNNGFVRLTGYTAKEVVGRSPGSFLQGPGTDRKTVERVRARLAAGESFYEEIMNYNKAKQSYWISLAINPVRNAKGEIDKFISIQANISETKRNSLDFNLKLDAIGTSNAMAEWKVSGDPIRTNSIIEDGSNRPVLLGQILDAATISQLLSTGSLHREIQWPRADQTPLWFEAVFAVLMDLDDKPERILMCGADITMKRAAIATSSEAMTNMMDEIVGIIERVSGFARQTNLLALNAAIEAARAQGAGKGFALIANEIRKLAVDAGSATGEISALLDRSRKQIDGIGGANDGLGGAKTAKTAKAA